MRSRLSFPNKPDQKGVLCLGIATQDHVFALQHIPFHAEKYRAKDFETIGGGVAANAAVAVARLGGKARLATRVGDDGVGRMILAELESCDVDCGLSKIVRGRRSAVSAVLIDAQGERLVVSYADPQMPEDIEHLPQRLPTGVAAVLADTRWEAAAKHGFAIARRANRIAVFDVDRAPRDAESLKSATHIVFSAQAIRELTGRDSVEDALADLGHSLPGWLAVTDGNRGTFLLEGKRVLNVPTFQVAAVDTLGAGDVYHGALALALGEGNDTREAVRFASAAAAIKCTRFGGRKGAPTRAEVDAFLATS
jgi:sulfofructose kinase